MAKTVAVSFEGDRVKVLHAAVRGKHVSVQKAVTMAEDEFDFYLRREKAAEFVVTCNFRNSFHDVLSLPAVKPAYLKKIVESEIRKATGRKDLTFIYSLLGERVADSRKVLDLFYVAVSSDEMAALVERFHRCGKTVKTLYPSVCAAASLLDSEEPGTASMGVLGIGNERLLFVRKKGALHLIRQYDALEAALTDFDIQNITMTVNYCFQNLRIKPSSVVLLGDVTEDAAISSLPAAPLLSLSLPESIRCSAGQFNEFILPVASLLTPGSSNVLSREYRRVYALRSWMSCAGRAFSAAAVLCLCLIFFVWNSIAEKHDLIEVAGNTIGDVNAVSAEYRARAESINRYQQAVQFVNRPAPDLGRLLSDLGGQETAGLSLQAVDASAREGGIFFLVISGVSRLDGYVSSQSALDRLAGSLGETGGVRVKSGTMNMADKTFRIELEYR